MANILLCVVSRGSMQRCEIGQWQAECVAWSVGTNNNTILCAVDQEPTPAARNLCVQQAKATQSHILVMVDNDMIPAPSFFRDAEFSQILSVLQGNIFFFSG